MPYVVVVGWYVDEGMDKQLIIGVFSAVVAFLVALIILMIVCFVWVSTHITSISTLYD